MDEAFPRRNTKGDCISRPEPGVGIYERYTTTSLFKTFYPLFFSMKMTGLYFVRQYPEPGYRSGSSFPTPSHVFATGCLIIRWLGTIRNFGAVSAVDQLWPDRFWQIMYLAFSIWATVNSTTFYIACYRSDWLPEFFIYWEDLQHLPKKSCHQYVRKQVVIVVFAWTIILLLVVYSVYIYLFDKSIADKSWPLTQDMPHFQYFISVFIIVNFLQYNAWIFPVIITFLTCVLLFKEFSVVNTELAHIIGDQEQLEMCMSVTRLRHQNVCKLVENADRFLRLHIAASLACNTVVICLNLYILVSDGWPSLDPLMFSICLTWTLMSFSYLGIVSVGAAMVNSQVFFYYLVYYYVSFHKLFYHYPA